MTTVRNFEVESNKLWCKRNLCWSS